MSLKGAEAALVECADAVTGVMGAAATDAVAMSSFRNFLTVVRAGGSVLERKAPRAADASTSGVASDAAGTHSNSDDEYGRGDSGGGGGSGGGGSSSGGGSGGVDVAPPGAVTIGSVAVVEAAAAPLVKSMRRSLGGSSTA